MIHLMRARPIFLAVCWASAVTVLAIVFLYLAAGTAMAQSEACGGASVVIEGGDPPRFTLPEGEGSTLRVESDAVLRISAEDRREPPARRQFRLSIIGFGFDIDAITRDLSPAAGADPITVEVDEVLPSFARGLYNLEGTLIDDGTERCTVAFDVRVGSFGGPIAAAAAGTAGVAAAGALASVPLAANGMNAKLKAKVQLQRRRPSGWRRFVPVPAWKRTFISTLIGAITGLATAVVMQQAGQSPLSITTALSGLIGGGGLTFGMGYSIGVLRTFLKPPEVEEEA